MAKTAITVNGSGPGNIFPAFIVGSAAAACGDDVVLFFTPGGAPALVKGEIEKMSAKGMPDLKELVEGLQVLGGRIIACELAIEAKDIKKEDFREGVEIMGVTSFLGEISDAQITFSF
ncbi:MAG: peroxiredoxin [Dehalococcoidia bacterium]|nr:MAG: peroxiredoxin [Dehalococcoidia bacterium]